MSVIVHYGQFYVNGFLSETGGDLVRTVVQNGRVPNRLRQIREGQGKTLEEVAALWRSTPPEIDPVKATAKSMQRFETDERQLKLDQAQKFARIYEVDLEDISPAASDTPRVPIVGYVGAGEVIHSFEDQEPLEWVRPIGRPGADRTNAVIVRGDSMRPAFQPGYLLFYFPTDVVAEDALNKDCVVRLTTGEMYVKTLKRGTSEGRFRLVSCRAAVADIEDAEVQWAARIRWTEHR